MFSDEARFGVHSKLGHGWFKKGSRIPVKMKLGYKNFYIYGCASPINGKHFTFLLPHANTICMNFFLKQLSLEYESKKIILVIDGAGWHSSKALIVPQNIELVYLPPYSPELNPVERLWLYIKRSTIRNKIYRTIDDLEVKVCDFIQTLTETSVQSICSPDYLFNYNM